MAEHLTIIPRTNTELAHNLGLKVVAEGVESIEQHQILLAHGCECAQGYLYSRQFPSAEFKRFIQQQSLTQG